MTAGYESDPWGRADAAVSALLLALARWRGDAEADVFRGVRWFHAAASGERSRPIVSVSLSVAEAEELARLLAGDGRGCG